MAHRTRNFTRVVLVLGVLVRAVQDKFAGGGGGGQTGVLAVKFSDRDLARRNVGTERKFKGCLHGGAKKKEIGEKVVWAGEEGSWGRWPLKSEGSTQL